MYSLKKVTLKRHLFGATLFWGGGYFFGR